MCSRQERNDSAPPNSSSHYSSNANSRCFQSRITEFFSSNTNSPSNKTHRQHTLSRILSLLNMYIQNVRGMRTKSNKFYCNSSSSDYNVISLTETWLNKDHSSSEFFDSTFNVFRKDRCETNSIHERGGGVLIAVRSNLICNQIMLSNTNDIECVCVKIMIGNNSSVYIYNAYVPPNSSPDVYASHSRAILSVHQLSNQADTVIITGDFNIPNSNWMVDES